MRLSLFIAVLSIALGFFLIDTTAAGVLALVVAAHWIAITVLLRQVRRNSRKAAPMSDIRTVQSKDTLPSGDLEKFKLAVDNAFDHIAITTPDGTIVYGNRSVERITGYHLSEILGTKAGKKWGGNMPKEYYATMWHTIKDRKETFHGQMKNRRKNGEYYYAEVTISPVLDAKGVILYYIAVERDVTASVEIDKAKTEFVSLASHQLRTPLAAMNWYTEMLLDGDAGALTDEQRKYVKEIHQGNAHLIKLVNALLNVSRLELGTFMIEPVETDLSKLVTEEIDSLREHAKRGGVSLEADVPTGISLKTDPQLTQMVVENLLSNALKYTLANGSVKCSLSQCPVGGEVNGRQQEKNSFVLTVSDTGLGIPSHQQEKIFSKLFRADNVQKYRVDGTGLGLYIVKQIVDAFGGTITFRSEENKGTTFYVTFPAAGVAPRRGTRALTKD